MPNSPTAIMTATGRYFDPLNPQPKDIDIRSIAVGLGRAPRFAGQTSRLISVAEHSLRVADAAAAQAVEDGWPEHWVAVAYLDGLLHDSEESILTDTPSPIKTPEQRIIGKAVRDVIYRSLGCGHLLGPGWAPVRALVKRVDMQALHYEAWRWQPGSDDWTGGWTEPQTSARWGWPVRGLVDGMLALVGRWDLVWTRALKRALARERQLRWTM